MTVQVVALTVGGTPAIAPDVAGQLRPALKKKKRARKTEDQMSREFYGCIKSIHGARANHMISS